MQGRDGGAGAAAPSANLRSGRASLRAWIFAALIVAFACLYVQTLSVPAASGFAVPKAAVVPGDPSAPLYDERYASHAVTPSVHSAAAIAVPGGLRAFWYGGTREGADDVAIYSATYSQESGAWGPESPVVTPAATQEGLRRYVRKLGNPVVVRDAQGRLRLFYVSVSIGGWSASAINMVVSDDQGATWSAPRRLIASPFMNISTLVKGRPFLYEDGSIGLPAYHELAGKFGELLRLDQEGNVIAKTRLSRGREAIQPTVVVLSPSRAVAFMRNSGGGSGGVWMLRTGDGGQEWSRPEQLALPNRNAAVDAAALAGGEMILIFNNGDRSDLSLAVSSDEGASWRVLYAFEKDSGAPRSPEFSYPWIAPAQDGSGLHLLYTWKRSHIKHIKFNGDWLRQKQ